MVTRNHSQWLFEPSALGKTPAADDGFDFLKEMEERRRCVRLMTRMAMSMQGLPQTGDLGFTVSTAAQYIHRFYMRQSPVDYQFQNMAATTLFFALKDTENGRNPKHIVHLLLSKMFPNEKITQDHKDWQRWIATILQTEEALFSALCFDFVSEGHPHSRYAEGVRKLHPGSKKVRDPRTGDISERPKWEQYGKTGWGLIDDSFPTPLCLLQPPNVIASAAYILARFIIDGIPPAQTLATYSEWQHNFRWADDPSEADFKHDVVAAMRWILHTPRNATVVGPNGEIKPSSTIKTEWESFFPPPITSLDSIANPVVWPFVEPTTPPIKVGNGIHAISSNGDADEDMKMAKEEDRATNVVLEQ